MTNWRIFWICDLVQIEDGYWYHRYTHLFRRKGEWVHVVFAGYNKRAINRKSTSWKTLKERLK